MLKACRMRSSKAYPLYKNRPIQSWALPYFILCGKRNTKPFDVICAIVVAYIGRTECRLLSFKPLFSFSIFKCLWGHSHHCQAPKKRRRKRRTSGRIRPNVKSRYTIFCINHGKFTGSDIFFGWGQIKTVKEIYE